MSEFQVPITKHPKWIQDFLKTLIPYEARIVGSRFFAEMASGELSLDVFRYGLQNFYPLVDSFPKYMGLSLTHVPNSEDGHLARSWLIRNIGLEARHVSWYRDWAVAFGVPTAAFAEEIKPPPAIDAVNNFLWRVCTYGSLAEAIASVNYGIEGPTGVWTRCVHANIRRYERSLGIALNAKSLLWLRAHAAYDDHHPVEALELIKRLATTENEQRRALEAAKTSMEYYAIAAEACFQR